MNDEAYMRRAIAVGRRRRGSTGENPSVGCVIVSGGEIVAAASTAPGGRPHAETRALAMAGGAARGATAFVSLEPCCHHGQTPPCVDALIDAGVARVVTALDDPDPRVSGGGHQALLDAGIEVTQGMLADQAKWELRAFLKRHINKRAYVTLKLAVSADGKIASKPGEPTAITGETARDRVHLLRAEVDAILVGVSTVLADDPDLTCRLPGMKGRSPVRVVSDSRLSIPLASRLVATANDVPVWIMTTNASDPAARVALEAKGVHVIECLTTGEGKVDLDDMLVKLADRGVSHVLAEGGAHMAKALVEADLVDEVLLLQAPVKIGPQGLAAMAGLPLDTIRASARFRQRGESETLGADWLAKYVRVR